MHRTVDPDELSCIHIEEHRILQLSVRNKNNSHPDRDCRCVKYVRNQGRGFQAEHHAFVLRNDERKMKLADNICNLHQLLGRVRPPHIRRGYQLYFILPHGRNLRRLKFRCLGYSCRNGSVYSAVVMIQRDVCLWQEQILQLVHEHFHLLRRIGLDLPGNAHFPAFYIGVDDRRTVLVKPL